MFKNTPLLVLVFLLAFNIQSRSSAAEETTQARSEYTPPPSETSPYTVPWQVRPILAPTVLRVDSAISFYNDRTGKSGGLVKASVLTGGYKIAPKFAIFGRVGVTQNTPPTGTSGTSMTNPLVAGVFSCGLPHHLRMNLFFGITAPLGGGGGNSPNAATQSTNAAGILARSAMDNALFAVNYLTVIPGAGLAYIKDGLTLQAEATLLQLNRVRGEKVDKDAFRTNLTSGLFAGYSLTPLLSLGTELRYQRWLNNNTVATALKPAKENLSFAVGPRFNFKVGSTTWRPGVAYAQGLAGPMASGNFTSPTHTNRVLFLDVPIFF